MSRKQCCPTCGQSIEDKRVTLTSGMVLALWAIYNVVKPTGQNKFRRSDIKHLFVSESQSARFGDWILFGDIVKRVKAGMYEINMSRASAFFRGSLSIPIDVTKEILTDEIKANRKAYVFQIKGITAALENGDA